MQTSPTVLARFALVIYVLALAVILFQPTPEIAAGTVGHVEEVLVQQGYSERVTGVGRVELLLNALMIAPVPFLGAWAFPRVRWTDWIAYTFLASSAVEVAQGVFLDARSAQFVDIVANTAGGVIGGVAAVMLARVFAGAAWLPQHPADPGGVRDHFEAGRVPQSGDGARPHS